jgi:hypothetical protein
LRMPVEGAGIVVHDVHRESDRYGVELQHSLSGVVRRCRWLILLTWSSPCPGSAARSP